MNEAFKLYKEGVSLVKSCNAQLDKVEKQLVVLNNGADEAFESRDDINTDEDDK